MYGKKILSLLTILFSGSQLISLVTADDCKYNSGATTLETGKCDGSSYLVSNGGEKVTDSTGVAACVSPSAKCTLVNCPNDAEGDNACSKESDYSGFVVHSSLVLECTSGECSKRDMFTSGNDYLVRVIDDSLGKKGKSVVAKSDDGEALSLATIDNGEYCVSSTWVVTPLANEDARFEGFCSGCTIYECDNTSVCSTELTLDCRTDGEPTCDPTKTKATDPDNNEEGCNVGYYLKSNILYKCENGPVSCTAQDGESDRPAIPKGYFADAENTGSYIQCNGSICTQVSNTGVTNCESNKPGDLIYVSDTGYRLCTGGNDPVEFNTGDKYLVKISESSTNAFSTITAEKSIFIDVTDDTILFKEIAGNGNYIVSTGNKIATTAGAGTLIQCSGGDGTCGTPASIPTGYLKNTITDANVQYIECGNRSCKAIKPASVENCTGKNPGDIINESGTTNYKLCVTADIPISLSGSSVVKYMVGAVEANNSNPFFNVAVDGKFIVVDVTVDAIVHTQDKKKYRYTDSSQKIYDDGKSSESTSSGGVCNKSDGSIVEYSIDFCDGDDYDYYTKGSSKIWSTPTD